ncbi:MAG: TonB-dependent receptor plug domain-containing protein, partial [Sphingomonas sp.]|uniref:TonB-dependent receptor plug domain-containing protein n=1 Tax=Sphingomonas sp. TaxID=28214 RepID=UPI003F81468B
MRATNIRRTLFASVAIAALAPIPALAQETPPAASTASADTSAAPAAADPAPQDAPADQKDIVVTGARATQRNSIDLKRNSSVIVDGIVNDEIGAQPDNSVGDTLERIAGVSADRFKGNANELSVRGLG